MRDIDLEIMSNLLEEANANLTEDQIKYIVKGFIGYMEMEREMSFYSHTGSTKEECKKCKSLQYDLKEAEKTIAVYKNSVMQRRGASAVWIEGDTVRYEK